MASRPRTRANLVPEEPTALGGADAPLDVETPSDDESQRPIPSAERVNSETLRNPSNQTDSDDETALEEQQLAALRRQVAKAERHHEAGKLRLRLEAALRSPRLSNSSHRGNSRPRDSSSDDGVPTEKPTKKRQKMDLERSMSIREPPPYQRSSYHALKEFITCCEQAFALRPTLYEEDQRKVLWAQQFLKGETQSSWLRATTSRHEPTHSWAEFRSWLYDDYSPPLLREMHTIRSWFRTIQREEQSVSQYASALESLEEDLEHAGDEKWLRWRFLSGLKQTILDEMTSHDSLPTSRADLVALAIRMEQKLQHKQAPAARSLAVRTRDGAPNPFPRDRRGRLAATANSGADPSTPVRREMRPSPADAPRRNPGTGANRNVECAACKIKGHAETECWFKNPELRPKSWGKPDPKAQARST